jgi:ubiquinone/menaquinone biosynthesis C-methylase UbiE
MSEPGDEHYDEISENYLDRLATNWPEPREQMHHGGWQATYDMVRLLNLDEAEHALDLCCGEGATARWLAKTVQRRVTGVDILEKAIAFARAQAVEEDVAHLVSFEVANVFKLPFPDETFDVIYGQDPDGLAHHRRQLIFEECRRVLKPGGRIGFHHWMLGPGAPDDVRARFDRVTIDVGFPSMYRLSVEEYRQDMHAAGLVDIVMQDMSDVYRKHMEAMERAANERQPGSLDAWTAMVLDLMRQGYKVGVVLSARRV